MLPESTERVTELVEEALEREPSERARFLDEACRNEPEIRAEVDSLLGFQDRARDFIERPAYEEAAETLLEVTGKLRVGQIVGGYKIVSLIGEGGMGEVYLAEDRQLHRRVALKLVRRGMDSDEVVRRFKYEQRMLGALNHPNIAQLYEADVTDEGIPFFAMEYVDGIRIDDYCEEKKLSVHERLELFCKVCAAIHYAHQHLVVHRDVKPSNILVTADGEPKLLDFGIAKLLESESGLPELTITLPGVMTPEYASPEHVRGEAITTASDVYSLGVLLYELLTGAKPYKIENRTPVGIARAITEQEPKKPSTAIARSQKLEVRDQKLLRGDLDNIVLMAMRKEPQRRYSSVAQFAADIRRHLDGLPVRARKGTFRYRSSKFIKRHTAGVVAASLVALAVIVGSIISMREAHRANVQRARAERRFNEVRRLSHSLMFEIHDSMQNLQGSTPTRQLIVTRALEYLDSLAQEAGDDASLQQELATAYKKVGDIQGNPYSANLGDIDGAMHSYRRAQEIYESLVATAPKKVDVRRDLTALYDHIGEVRLHASDTKGGLEIFQKSRALRQQLIAETPNDTTLQRELAVSRMKIGEASQKLGDIKTALEEGHQALAAFESLAARDPQNRKAMRDVMIISNKLGYNLYVAGDLAAALESYRKGFRIADTLASKDPDNAVAQRDLSVSCNNIGRILLKQENATGAEESFKKSLEVARKLAAIDPKNELARSDVAYVLIRLGAAQTAAGEYRDALESQREALAINEALFAANPKHTFTLSEIGDGYNYIGDTLGKMKDWNSALDNYRRAAAAREKMSAADVKDAQYRQSVAESYQALGRVSAVLAADAREANEQLSRWKEARTWTKRSLEIWHDLQSRGAVSASDAGQVAEAQTQQERCEMALANTPNDSN